MKLAKVVISVFESLDSSVLKEINEYNYDVLQTLNREKQMSKSDKYTAQVEEGLSLWNEFFEKIKKAGEDEDYNEAEKVIINFRKKWRAMQWDTIVRESVAYGYTEICKILDFKNIADRHWN